MKMPKRVCNLDSNFDFQIIKQRCSFITINKKYKKKEIL